MTWSHDPINDVFDNGSAEANLKAALQSLVGKGDASTPKGDWTMVGQAGLGANHWAAVFTFTDVLGKQRQWQWSIDYGDATDGFQANCEYNANYDPDETDLDSTGNAFPFKPSLNSGGGGDPEGSIHLDSRPMKLFRSTENPASFICMLGNQAYYTFFGAEEFFAASLPDGDHPNSPSYPSHDMAEYVWYGPGLNNNTAHMINWPLYYANDDVNMMMVEKPGYLTSVVNTTFFSSMPLCAYNICVGNVTQDVLYRMPGGAAMDGYYAAPAQGATPVYDGTKYWIFLGGVGSECWVLDCAENDPTTWVLG